MELQQETGDVRAPWTAAILVALAVMGIYLFASTRTTLWDRDEPFYARATVEMVESGNYLVPTFNNDMWPDKPILSYWLMSLPIRLLGPTEFACRFFAAVGAALTCLLTFFMGKRLLSAKAGLWAMVILASTSMVLSIGTLAISDAVLLPFIVGALVVFVHSFGLRVRVFHIVLIGIALGFGMLAKGPIGLLPIPVIIVATSLGRRGCPNCRGGGFCCLGCSRQQCH
jgi:4-amino-4-deoxy-L-arabinose transferase-like glycosyltransferase